MKVLLPSVLLLTLLTLPAIGRRRRGRGKVADNNNLEYHPQTNSTRNEKLFSLFNVVTFKNDPCASNSIPADGMGRRNGTCFTSSECSSKSGQASGNCAAGFGVCCVFILAAGTGTVRENCTYVQNPNFPQSLPNTNNIQYTVQRCSNEVSTLRLDFEVFSIQGVGGTAQPNEGVCSMDTFTVTTPTAPEVPVICGENSDQHMYVDIGSDPGDTATLAFAFNGASDDRVWDIKITQLECTNPNRPPTDCLQYHTGTQGRIETFNFRAMNDNHLNNQRYTICIRQEAGRCCVEYFVCRDQTFTLAIGGLPAGFSFDGSNVGSKQDDQCKGAKANPGTEDFITIPQAMGTCKGAEGSQSRFCGSNLNFAPGLTVNAPVCDCTPPFVVGIQFQNNADNTITGVNAKVSKGLCLEYLQVDC